jgi:hypothetical protein
MSQRLWGNVLNASSPFFFLSLPTQLLLFIPSLFLVFLSNNTRIPPKKYIKKRTKIKKEKKGVE